MPLLSDPLDIQTRAYSIASSPSEPDLLFVIKLKHGGRASEWIEHAVTEGTDVRIQGPFGLFVLRPDDAGYIFAATGAGIAPFRSHIRATLESGDTRPMRLLFGVREPRDFFWTNQFRELASTYPQFHFLPTLSGTDASWQGLRGRVQANLPRALAEIPGAGVYICGAPEMVQDVKAMCLQEFAVPKTKVHAEGYI